MMTPNRADRLEGRNLDQAAKFARRRRVLTAINCDTLEGRRLMTGFAGAAAGMMGHGPAEMSGMADHWQRFDAGSGDGGAATGQDDKATSGVEPMMTSSIRVDHQPVAGSAATGSDDSGRLDLKVMNDLAGRPLGGDRGDRGMDRDLGDGEMGDDRGDSIPTGDQPGMSTQGRASTGNTQLDADLTKLHTDEQAIHDKSQVTPALLAAVRKDLEAIDKAATGTADATALKTEQTDGQTIFASKAMPTDAQKAQLQADHDAVLKSEGVSQTLIDQLAADRLAVKTASNFTAADQATLDADHKAIDADRAAMSTDSSASASTTAAATTTTTAAATAGTTSSPSATANATSSTDPTSTTPPAADPGSSDPSTPTAAPPAVPMMAPADPQISQATSTATQTAAPGGGSHRRGRNGMGEVGMDRSNGSASLIRSSAAHPGGTGHNLAHPGLARGRGMRGPRG